jgi:hypothetical protein
VFELGLWCGTCPALFQKLSEPEAADLGVVNQRLNAGLVTIESDVLQAYAKVLPESQYTALLIEMTPQLVEPGSVSDYFSHEQISTWGVDPAVGSPENPATPYYRTFETPLGPDQHLYEFVVPMVPPAWNDRERVSAYQESAAETTPTAGCVLAAGRDSARNGRG